MAAGTATVGSGTGVRGSGILASSNTTGFPVGVWGGVDDTWLRGVWNGGQRQRASTVSPPPAATGLGGIVRRHRGTGQSTSGTGGRAISSGAANTFAVQGVNQSTGEWRVGVYGASTGGYGVLGISSKVGFARITGITSTANVPAFEGGSTTPSALAA